MKGLRQNQPTWIQLHVPHMFPPPALEVTKSTQNESHAVLQQSAFFAHTHDSTLASEHPGVLAAVQQSVLHVDPQPSPPTSATHTSSHFSEQHRGSFLQTHA